MIDKGITVLITLALVTFLSWLSYMWYVVPCDELKTNPVTTYWYAPMRCL